MSGAPVCLCAVGEREREREREMGECERGIDSKQKACMHACMQWCAYLEGVARVRVDRLHNNHHLQMRARNMLFDQLPHLEQL